MEIYGKALARYRGRGRLFLRGETPLPCRVNIAQRSDGVIVVECQASGARAPMITLHRVPAARSATLSSGTARVCVSRLFGPTSLGWRSHRGGNLVTLLYYANQVDVSYGPGNASPSQVRFGVLNFEYLGNALQQAGNSIFLGALRACLPSGGVLFEWAEGYEEMVKRLKAVGGTDVTCHATMPLDSSTSLSRATRQMEDVCALLSFARGTKINWAYFDVLSEAGAKLHTRHVSRVTKAFTSFPVIHPQHAEDLLALLRCLQRFREGEEAHSLTRVFDHYTDSKSDRAFLEARAMLAAILIDFLVGRYRDRTGRNQIHRDFKRLQGRLATGLGELLSSTLPHLTEDQMDQLLENLPGLNRPAFRRVLREFADSLDLHTSDAEIRRIAKIRNSLVHSASFLHDTDNHTQYFQLINFLDRILLGMLGYTGYYLDCTRNWQRTEFSPSPTAR